MYAVQSFSTLILSDGNTHPLIVPCIHKFNRGFTHTRERERERERQRERETMIKEEGKRWKGQNYGRVGGREDVGWGVERREEGGLGLVSPCSHVQVSLWC